MVYIYITSVSLQIPDFQTMEKLSLSSPRDQRGFQVVFKISFFFFKRTNSVLEGVVGKSDTVFSSCSFFFFVLYPLPPGERRCGMLRGNVVWSVCWQKGKEAQRVLPQNPAVVKLCGPVGLYWVFLHAYVHTDHTPHSENVMKIVKKNSLLPCIPTFLPKTWSDLLALWLYSESDSQLLPYQILSQYL